MQGKGGFFTRSWREEGTVVPEIFGELKVVGRRRKKKNGEGK